MKTRLSANTHVFPKGRVFYFIDETGDPGHLSHETSSRYYQLNMTIISREGLVQLHRHMAGFRYFRDTGKELKRYTRDGNILAHICSELVYSNTAVFVSFILDKEKYTGPYLSENYDANKFRNFIIQKSTEYTSSHIIDIHSEDNNFEIVIDRYLESDADEQDLKQYLKKKNGLPDVTKIVQIDSEYSEALQVTDLIGRYVKEYFFDKNIEMPVRIFEFIQVFNIEDPDHIQRKIPSI